MEWCQMVAEAGYEPAEEPFLDSATVGADGLMHPDSPSCMNRFLLWLTENQVVQHAGVTPAPAWPSPETVCRI